MRARGRFAQRTDGEVGDDARNQRDQHLQPQHAEQQPRVDTPATNMGSISSDVERNTATSVPSVTTRPGVERGRHGREATLRNHAQQRTDNRAGGSAHNRVRAGTRGMFERFERDVGHKQKRHEREGVLERMLHEMQ